MSNGKIDIVAPQKEVIAYGDAFDTRKRRFGSGSNFKKSEVGGAAANVDDEHVMSAGLRKVGRYGDCVTATFQPPVKRGLRFFQQTDVVGKIGLARSVQGEPLRRCVKRGRNGDRNLLVIEWQSLSGKPGVPRRAQVSKEERGSANR